MGGNRAYYFFPPVVRHKGLAGKWHPLCGFPIQNRTLRSSREGEVWWEDRENLPNLRLAATDKMDVLRVFEEDNLSEFFYRQVGDKWVYELK